MINNEIETPMMTSTNDYGGSSHCQLPKKANLNKMLSSMDGQSTTSTRVKSTGSRRD